MNMYMKGTYSWTKTLRIFLSNYEGAQLEVPFQPQIADGLRTRYRMILEQLVSIP